MYYKSNTYFNIYLAIMSDFTLLLYRNWYLYSYFNYISRMSATYIRIVMFIYTLLAEVWFTALCVTATYQDCNVYIYFSLLLLLCYCAISCWERRCYRVYESWFKHGYSVWCDHWRIKLNASKTKTMILSRSSTVHPRLTQLSLDGTVLKESADLVILEAKFHTKMTFEKHLRSVSSAAAQRLGIMRKSWQVFHDRSFLLRSFAALSCRSWSIFQQCGARLTIPVLNYWRELSGVLFF